MSWGDILGGIGTIVGAAGGITGNGFLQGLGSLGSAAGGLVSAFNASDSAGAAGDTAQAASEGALALAQQQAYEERQAYMKMMGLIPQEQGALEAELKTLGPGYQVSPEAVKGRADQLLPEYMDQADKASSASFSKAIGGLMAAGLDDSTFGIQERGAQAASDYNLHRSAYNQAYTDAMKYVTDLSSGSIASRSEALKESGLPYDTSLSAYENLYGHSGGAGSTFGSAADSALALGKYSANNAALAGAGGSIEEAVKYLSPYFQSNPAGAPAGFEMLNTGMAGR